MLNDLKLSRRSALQLAGAGAIAATILPSGFRTVSAQETTAMGGEMLTALGLPELNLTISDTAFEGLESQLQAGMYVVHMTNNGSQPGFATFMQLPEGMTSTDLMTMLGGGGPDASPAAGEEGGEMGSPPDWFYTVHLPGGAGVAPGQTAHMVLDLRPGNYILWGEDPSAPQAPVDLSVSGMIGSPTPGAFPTADVSLLEIGTEGGYAFQIEGTLATGGQVVEIRNDSDQPHFVEFDLLPPGTPREDVDALMESFMSGTPSTGGLTEEDVQPVYFVGTQSAQTSQWHEMNLEPGTYLITCWIPDPARGGIPHAMEGMYDVIEIAVGPATPVS